MSIFKKVSVVVLAVAFMFGLAGQSRAATAPDLLSAANFAVLAGSAISDVPTSLITGHVGLSPNGGTSISGLTCAEMTGYSIYSTDAGYVVACRVTDATLVNTAKDDLLAAYNNAMAQATTTLVSDLAGMELTPGVYASASSLLNSGTVTLNGGGDANAVFIIKMGSTLTTASNSNVVLTGSAQACNVFWVVGSSVTLGTTSTIRGNVMAKVTITDNGGSTVYGRLLASDGAVTISKTTVTKQTCAAAAAAATTVSGPGNGTVNVVKVVINDGGGTKTVADFPLFVNGTLVFSGQTNNFPITGGVYSVTETSLANYTRTFSGDCDANGHFNLYKGNNVFCIVTNNDIAAPVAPVVPPLIDVVKTASPLSLPAGPGPVTYTYTVRNIGTVPMTDITMVGDTCSPIVLQSGDTNGDSKLDVSETWIFTCTVTLTETHTNTVVATGWANGISAVDIASANVVVGLPIVPPLIHVTKIPSPLALPAGGGRVTYTNKVTNPGVVALSNVSLHDDKCGTANYFSGDTNNDSKLDTTETWTFTCNQNLTKTTVNTVVATGEANGLIARDFAIVTVVVAAVVPKLPNTGFAPTNNSAALLAGMLALAVISLAIILKKRKI